MVPCLYLPFYFFKALWLFSFFASILLAWNSLLPALHLFISVYSSNFPSSAGFSTDSPIDHHIIVSLFHLVIHFLMNIPVVCYQMSVLSSNSCVCAHTCVHMYYFCTTEILNIWHRKCKEEKKRLFSTLLLSVAHHIFYFSIYNAYTGTMERFANILPVFRIFSILLSARYLWHKIFNPLFWFMIN